MSDLFKQAFTVAGIIGFGFLVFIGTSIITGNFNTIILKQRKFWIDLCGDRADAPVCVLAVLALGLITAGYFYQNPWILGGGLSTTVLCYFKYRETLIRDPFDRRD